MSEEELLDATYQGWRMGFDGAVDELRRYHTEALLSWSAIPVEHRERRAVARGKVSALVEALRRLGSHE